MTKEQYVTIRTYLSGAYANFNPGDLVWFENLKDYNFEVMIHSAKQYVKSNKFPPTIAQLTQIYEELKDAFRNKDLEPIILEMVSSGYFKHPSEIQKANNWIKRGIIPEWFKKDMEKYRSVKLDYKEQHLLA